MAGRAGRRGIDTIGHVVHCNNLFPIPTTSEYRALLSGRPQELVSKYHISYSVILNLLKNGRTSGFHEFSENSMMRIELNKSITAQNSAITGLQQELEKKRALIQTALKIPHDTCLEYLSLENNLGSAVNKKRKEIERRMREIQELSPKTWQEDIKIVKACRDITKEMDVETAALEYMSHFIENQTERVCGVLESGGFIQKNAEEQYELTAMGKIAGNIAEIHPLIMAEYLTETQFFAGLSPKQIVGFLACFTSVNVKEEKKKIAVNTDDEVLNRYVRELRKKYEIYGDKEAEQDLRTGMDYDDAIQYDMVDFSMKWCEYDTELECKQLIQTTISEHGISIGDFNKAMLKIVAISRELMNIAEEVGETDLLYRLNQIEGMILKYVTTSQSLYV
jgi:superfamily II RNA helicase